jgi:pimeloyl-ACP methyl ester carboxylesterase
MLSYQYLESVQKPKPIVNEFMFKTSDGIEIKYYDFLPALQQSEQPKGCIVYVAGWLSQLKDALKILRGFQESGYRTLYVESREKNSSTATENSNISGDRMFLDIYELIQYLNFQKPFIMMGQSFGAVASILQASIAIEPKTKPSRIIAIQPVFNEIMPKVAVGFFGLPTRIFRFIQRMARKLVPQLFPSLKERNTNLERFYREFTEADPGKLRKSVLGFIDMSLRQYWKPIQTPTLVLGVSGEKFHPFEEAKEIANKLPNAKFIDLMNDKISHSTEVVRLTEEFLQECYVLENIE